MPPSPLDSGEKLYCVSYAPFRGQQTPLDLSTRVEPWQIDEDLGRLAKLTDCIRIYSVDFGLDRAPEIAERHGLKVLLGLWVSSHADRTKYQIRHRDCARQAVSRRYPRSDRRQRGAAARRDCARRLGQSGPHREVAGDDAGDLRRCLGVLAASPRTCTARPISSPFTSCPTGRIIRSRRTRRRTISTPSAGRWSQRFRARRC